MQYQLKCSLGTFNFVSIDQARFGQAITGGTLHRILGTKKGKPVTGTAVL